MAALARTPAAGASVASPFKSPFRSGRVVGVRYSQFAPKPLLEQTLYGPPLDVAVATICDVLDRHPGELKVTEVESGALAITCRMRPTAPADLRPGSDQVVAVVTGITAPQFAVALLEIQRPNYVMVAR
jgi:hypothetical protein